jgi:hypothetical protein
MPSFLDEFLFITFYITGMALFSAIITPVDSGFWILMYFILKGLKDSLYQSGI